MKKCVACGMPMKEPGDFALGDTRKAYCRYCVKEDGSMKTFEEKQVDMERLLIRTQGISQGRAAIAVRSLMKELPAWQNYFRE